MTPTNDSRSLEAENHRLRAAVDEAVEVIRNFPGSFVVLDGRGKVVTWNEAAEHLFGYTAEEMLNRSYLELIPESTRFEERERFERELAGTPVSSVLVERIAKDGRRFSVLNEVARVRSHDDDRLVVSDRDLSERIEVERDREELRRTLDHRVKNVLTMVQGILDCSLMTPSDSVEGFAAASRNRVGALAIAHRAMATHQGAGADMEALVTLTFQALGLEGRILVEGQRVTLPESAASPLSLAFNELATNAVQHGALSEGDGRVKLRWEVGQDGDVHITWRESDGPGISKVSERGFGARLIEEALPYELGGTAHLDFRPEGLLCEIRFSPRADRY